MPAASADFHLAALREMVRVSRDEIRVHPLVDQAGRPLSDLVDHGFQRGATSMLRLRVPR